MSKEKVAVEFYKTLPLNVICFAYEYRYFTKQKLAQYNPVAVVFTPHFSLTKATTIIILRSSSY